MVKFPLSGYWPFGSVACYGFSYTSGISVLVNSYTLVVISFERCDGFLLGHPCISFVFFSQVHVPRPPLKACDALRKPQIRNCGNLVRERLTSYRVVHKKRPPFSSHFRLGSGVFSIPNLIQTEYLKVPGTAEGEEVWVCTSSK